MHSSSSVTVSSTICISRSYPVTKFHSTHDQFHYKNPSSVHKIHSSINGCFGKNIHVIIPFTAVSTSQKLHQSLPSNQFHRKIKRYPETKSHSLISEIRQYWLSCDDGIIGSKRKHSITLMAAAVASADHHTESASFRRSKSPQDINVLIVGSTGYIGKFVVKELVKRGYNVIAVARKKSGIRGKNSKEETVELLNGAKVCFSDVTDLSSLETSVESLGIPIDVVVSCLASRTGGVKDSWKIDYEATRNSLLAGRKFGAKHFVLLSAICVQKPLLEFQRAKLKLEDELQREAEEDGVFTYSIVRPTAFFKSLGAQVELVKKGQPYVMFGDGKLCACKPISEEDLASFIVDCVSSEDKINKILPIGGPGKAVTPLDQGEMLFEILGKDPKFLKVPIGIMDFAITALDFLVKIFPALEDAAEYGKIGRYYAAESMLVWDSVSEEYDADATPSYGKDTLQEFFARVIREGMAGQELGEQTIF